MGDIARQIAILKLSKEGFDILCSHLIGTCAVMSIMLTAKATPPETSRYNEEGGV